ncbi:hypothetical protein Lfu02_73390 [Longispora fulva]|uniref:Tetratricopeptide (TPR) repeat protein n=1 Tax=Longispora fulva TaxID=619741 RepID=A0A8J7G6P6_9ACTN|nr:hypothetical protein [Longispora fulva]MBG6133925.1 tetratricopeptide (TPR) repeat protein [Longispora fulva]GIG62967.1 hypothetical protein Lfu02_73390 [Longispora fulva]
MADEWVNYYEILQIAQAADVPAIRAAVSKERRTWIKRQASADPARRAEAELRVQQIDRAEQALLDAASRSAFDERLARQRSQPQAESTAGEGDWLERARAYMAMGNPGAAHRAAREATNLRGSDHEAWALRAQASFLTAQFPDAEFEFAESIRLEPENYDYHHDLGEVYSEQTKWAQAMREFDIALRLSPNNPVTRTAVAQIHLATEDAPKALVVMESVVSGNPDNEYFKYYLAAALEGVARQSLTLLRDGAIVATSEAQVQRLEQHADRIAALRLSDPDAAEAVRDLRRMAGASREMRWEHSNVGGWITGLVILMCIGCGGLNSDGGTGTAMALLCALPLMAGLVYLYVHLHRKPAWQHADAIFRSTNLIVRKGI